MLRVRLLQLHQSPLSLGMFQEFLSSIKILFSIFHGCGERRMEVGDWDNGLGGTHILHGRLGLKLHCTLKQDLENILILPEPQMDLLLLCQTYPCRMVLVCVRLFVGKCTFVTLFYFVLSFAIFSYCWPTTQVNLQGKKEAFLCSVTKKNIYINIS